MKKLIVALFVGLLSLVFAPFASATAPDFTSLTASVDFSTLITAVLLVLAGMTGVGIVLKGGKAIAGMLGFR